jgi:hypothetical protein
MFSYYILSTRFETEKLIGANMSAQTAEAVLSGWVTNDALDDPR